MLIECIITWSLDQRRTMLKFMPQVAAMLAALLHNCQRNLLKKFITGGWSFILKFVIFFFFFLVKKGCLMCYYAVFPSN